MAFSVFKVKNKETKTTPIDVVVFLMLIFSVVCLPKTCSSTHILRQFLSIQGTISKTKVT